MQDLTEDRVAETVREHGPYVWRTLYALGVNRDDIPDVCQEVFIVVHRKLSSFEGRSALRTWLYGICLRQASTYRRGLGRRREDTVEQLPEIEVEAAQSRALQRSEARVRLMQALECLDEDKRRVLVLFDVEGLSMKEITDLLEIPRRTAYSRLEAARTEVRRHWKRSESKGGTK